MRAFGSLCAVLFRVGQGGEPGEDVSAFDCPPAKNKNFGMPKF
jgi:hypothetical protein